MANENSNAMVIWRIDDGKPGHANQSLGLVNAISRLANVDCHNLRPMKMFSSLLNLFLKKFPPGKNLPAPALIIGAGHGTHLSVLCASRACGGKTVILMKPSLPIFLFDLCLIPEHDCSATADNIITTRGAINNIVPVTSQNEQQGLILIGGPSRHFGWDTNEIIRQVTAIVKSDPLTIWRIADSSRTPAITSMVLRELKIDNLTYHFCNETPAGWLTDQLNICGKTWVTADSVSMVYESLTSGTATGILEVPVKKPNKISRSINMLDKDNMVTLFRDWQDGKKPGAPAEILNEAGRCAREVINKLYEPGKRK